MGSKSKKAKQDIPRYNMSLHYGICAAPVDSIEAITIAEKKAWEGNATGNTTIVISNEGLFGGIMKEGGVEGAVEFYFGGQTQLVSAELASRLGGSPGALPGFRGIVTAFFRGVGRAGFYWCANTPYLKDLWFRVKSIHTALGVANAAVPRPDGSPGAPDMNPAHAIYSCYTNTDWGMGETTASLDAASFNAAAATLYAEKLGVSMRWSQAGTTEEFVNQILDHIDAVVFTHPATGLVTLRLIRNDYNPATLREVTMDNARLTNFARKGWGETINEIKVTWTNPANEQEETVYAQDLGNIAMQGGLVSDSKNYFGIRTAWKAQELANRELRKSSASLCSCEAEVNRQFWDVTPYECIKLFWPEYGINGMIMRVAKVSYGTIESPTIKLSLVEDIFSLPTVAFVPPPTSGWVDPSPPPVNATEAMLLPVTAYSLLQEDLDLTTYSYPATAMAILVASPYVSGSVSYDVDLETMGPTGSLEWTPALDTQQFATRGDLVGALVAEASSIIAPLTNVNGIVPRQDWFLMIGTPSTAIKDMEIALISSRDVVTGDLSLLRGAMDTVPKNWPAGTRVWAIPADMFDPLPPQYTVAQTVKARVRTTTPLGSTPPLTSPIFTNTAAARPTLPLRPANVKLNGVGFGTASLVSGDNLVLTWAHRNRLLEDTTLLTWTAPSTATEAGLTYRVQSDAYNAAGGLITANWFNQDVGLVDTYTINVTTNPMPAGTAAVVTRVIATVDGHQAWQTFENRAGVLLAPTGLVATYTP